jgi:hypothetical protein
MTGELRFTYGKDVEHVPSPWDWPSNAATIRIFFLVIKIPINNSYDLVSTSTLKAGSLSTISVMFLRSDSPPSYSG